MSLPIPTEHQRQYYAWLLTRRAAGDSVESLASTLVDSQVDLNPHQVDAALFACRNPLSRGVILADEVGLGKTIEAGLVISQRWAERRRRLLIIVPANLRKQWHQELQDKFNLQGLILETKSYNALRKQGVRNPFVFANGPVICSYQFAKAKAKDVKAIAWDLVVLDEAHRLRNVYKSNNVIGKTLKDALAHVHSKVLLTATPLQNSLLELYGLVSMIDDRVFGDIDSFRAQFVNSDRVQAFGGLRQRLGSVCKRTLRRQVQQYVPYTARRAIVQEFTPSQEERELSGLVAEYLRRPNLNALPEGQRQLISLVLWKLLASSTHAIAGALDTMARRLQGNLDKASEVIDLTQTLDEDYEGLDELADESEKELDSEEVATLAAGERDAIAAEIAELQQFKNLATSIRENAKGKALLIALERAFAELERLGAARKAIIFTESRRTQEYLKRYLEVNGYRDKLVTFNGTNTDPDSNAIYRQWLEANRDSDTITGSAPVDRRTALIDAFRHHAEIMIATEAAAEGVNLQFCSLVINYDLPWNPQRVEQRIGRCHRYGQKHDVVVVNFVNTRNEADKRVLELLTDKFNLFNGVFGASDEVLGRIESGIDFEKRILDIYQSCRTQEEIEQAFESLQKELEADIAERLEDTRKLLLEHFDEDIHDLLKIQLDAAQQRLDKVGRLFWDLSRHVLRDKARFDDDKHDFMLVQPPKSDLKPGHYQLIRKDLSAEKISADHLYRLTHPLGEYVLEEAKQLETPTAAITFDITNHPSKISVVEALKDQSGWLCLDLLTVDSFQREERLVFTGLKADGNPLDAETCERFFACKSAGSAQSIADTPPALLQANAERHCQAVISRILEANNRFFQAEREKLEKWADDKILAAEQALQDTKAKIRGLKRESRQAETVEQQHSIQRQIRELERLQRRQRQQIFDVEDSIIEKRDQLIDTLEQRMNQHTQTTRLFTIQWHVV